MAGQRGCRQFGTPADAAHAIREVRLAAGMRRIGEMLPVRLPCAALAVQAEVYPGRLIGLRARWGRRAHPRTPVRCVKALTTVVNLRGDQENFRRTSWDFHDRAGRFVLQHAHQRTVAIVLGGALQKAGGSSMRIVVAAVIAFVVAIGLVRPAGVFDPDRFWQQQSPNLP